MHHLISQSQAQKIPLLFWSSINFKQIEVEVTILDQKYEITYQLKLKILSIQLSEMKKGCCSVLQYTE